MRPPAFESVLVAALVIGGCGDGSGDGRRDAGLHDADPGVDAASLDAPDAEPGTCAPEIEARLLAGRVLSLTGAEIITLGSGPCSLARVCVTQSAGLRIDGAAQLTITGSLPSVIAGAGIGSIDTDLARLDLDFAIASDAYLVIENQVAPFELVLGAANNNLTILITGSAGLTVNGVASMITYGGDPTQFPGCP